MVTGTASTTDTMYAATDCKYGGTIKSIEAVDDNTVKFTLCLPDPAFPSKVAFASVGIQSAKHLEETGGGTPPCWSTRSAQAPTWSRNGCVATT